MLLKPELLNLAKFLHIHDGHLNNFLLSHNTSSFSSSTATSLWGRQFRTTWLTDCTTLTELHKKAKGLSRPGGERRDLLTRKSEKKFFWGNVREEILMNRGRREEISQTESEKRKPLEQGVRGDPLERRWKETEGVTRKSLGSASRDRIDGKETSELHTCSVESLHKRFLEECYASAVVEPSEEHPERQTRKEQPVRGKG
ncbi:hypothetical protein KM043_014328 [Ampulex compressa]|nr:hypothetical protein KM043_014328 [Ampulex compressa]